MSTNTIQMYVNIKKNNVSTSTGFGKFYLNADTNETLSNEGLVNHILHHNCAVGREAIAAVIKKLGECIPELVAQGQPVKIEGLGTFYPTAESSPIVLNKLLDVKYKTLRCSLQEFRDAGGFPVALSTGSQSGGGGDLPPSGTTGD